MRISVKPAHYHFILKHCCLLLYFSCAYRYFISLIEYRAEKSALFFKISNAKLLEMGIGVRRRHFKNRSSSSVLFIALTTEVTERFLLLSRLRRSTKSEENWGLWCSRRILMWNNMPVPWDSAKENKNGRKFWKLNRNTEQFLWRNKRIWIIF